jgi:hypothetical protein
MGTSNEELIKQMELHTNQIHCEVLAIETVLKVLITRLLPPGADHQFLAEVEQQCLHSIQGFENRQQQLIQPQIEGIFSELRQWAQGQTTAFDAPESEQ